VTRKEVRRYIVRSRWCNSATFIFLLWTLCLTYAMLYDSRAYTLVIPLSVILFMLLGETIYICVYQVEG